MDSITLERLRDFTKKYQGYPNDTEISFEGICVNLFPIIWDNVQKELKYQYTQGYIAGLSDQEKE